MMKRALIDASSAILLYKARLFDAVSKAYQLLVVPTVFAEITVPDRPGSSTFRRIYQGRLIWHVDRWPTIGVNRLTTAMGAGERDTLIAYRQGASDFIIIDDLKGAKACRANAFPYINALLCPRILYLAGAIEASFYEDAFMHLQRIGRYSAEVVEYANACSPDALTDFYPTPLPSP